jgi:hypothetical protein
MKTRRLESILTVLGFGAIYALVILMHLYQ